MIWGGPGPLVFNIVVRYWCKRKRLKRNWNWRNNRLFCHIFVIGEISIGGRPTWPSQCSNCGRQKRYLQIFGEVSDVFLQNFNGSKIVLSSSQGQGNFRGPKASKPRPRTWGFEAKDFKMRPRGQGRPRALHISANHILLKWIDQLPKRRMRYYESSITWNQILSH